MTPVRTSTGPEILLFKRFKHKWQFVDLDNFRAARKAVETLVDQFYSHSLEFAKKYLELEEPRDDYRGFLELSAFISQRCSRSCNPNASPHASGTLDGQSYWRDKDGLVPWPIQVDNARTKWYSLYSLSVLIHLRAWMPAQLPVVVPLNDIRPTVWYIFSLTHMQLFQLLQARSMVFT